MEETKKKTRKQAERPDSGTKETKEYVRQKLIEIGCEPVDCGKAGLVAVIGGKKTGKTFSSILLFILRVPGTSRPVPGRKFFLLRQTDPMPVRTLR